MLVAPVPLAVAYAKYDGQVPRFCFVGQFHLQFALSSFLEWPSSSAERPRSASKSG
jgi:hypothetical protein